MPVFFVYIIKRIDRRRPYVVEYNFQVILNYFNCDYYIFHAFRLPEFT